jgi:hypothetical protein
MADEQKQSNVQILPPERREVQLPPNTPAGIPFLAQAKYWAARRALESYTKALASQTAAYRELEARERAKVGFERSLVQSEHLDDIRRIEELKIIEELASLVEAGEVREFRTRATRAQAEGDAIASEQRLEGIKNPSAAEIRPERSAPEQAALDITQIRADAAALRKALIDSYGGEDKLSDEDRGILEQLDVAIRNKVVERLENI